MVTRELLLYSASLSSYNQRVFSKALWNSKGISLYIRNILNGNNERNPFINQQ